MMYAKSKLQIAAERYGIDPKRFGDTHAYTFVWSAAIGGGANTIVAATPIKIQNDCLLLSLGGQPSDGAAASYAGLSLDFTFGGKSLASDGQTVQFVPFAVLFGRADHPLWDWEVPVFIKSGIAIAARVQNNTAGALTPSVICRVVEIRPA